MPSEQEKTTIDRSPLYPVFSINECIAFVDEIKKIGGKKVSVETIASILGTSVKTNSFKSKISTAKQFGLIRGTAGAVELTELAKRILYPVDDRDVKEAKIVSFLSAPLFRKITDRFENQAIPNVDRLSNILLLEYGMSKRAKDIAALKYIESAEQLGVLQNGVIILEADDETTLDVQTGVSEETGSNIDSNLSGANREVAHRIVPAPSGYQFSIPTLSGAVAQITIPLDVTIKDLDFIMLYIQNMLPAFISNLKEELN